MSKAGRVPLYGLAVAVGLIVIECVLPVGHQVYALFPCKNVAISSVPCYVAYDLWYLLLLVTVALGFLIAIIARLVKQKWQERGLKIFYALVFLLAVPVLFWLLG